MKAYRVTRTIYSFVKDQEISRRIRQTFVSPIVAAQYYVANPGSSIREITVSDYKIAPSHKRLHTVHV